MATKTFFGYQGHLTSKGLTEAISLQHGPGPLFGYAGFEITGNTITIRPAHNTVQDSQLSEFTRNFGSMVNTRFPARRIQIKDLDNSLGNFGIITKDGYIEVSTDEVIELTINNNRGLNPEVIVVARHSYSEDVNIEVPVVYEAYWSQSSIRFFDLYKKSIDWNYPTALEDRSVEDLDINTSPIGDNQLSFHNLENSAFAACGISNDSDSYTLVGIYGTGNDRMNNSELQKFIILPYDGKFPMEIGYSYSEQSFLKDLMRHLYKVFKGIGNKTFRQYLVDILSETEEEDGSTVVQATMPVGAIIMWYGSTQSIPYGWEICDGTASVHNPSILKPDLMGRFPIGLSQSETDYIRPGAKGGNNQLNLEINNIPQHAHVYTADAESAGKFNSIETGFPNVYSGSTEKVSGTAGSAGDQGVAQAYLTSKVGGSKPVDNRPAYTVVCFIIKTL